MNTNETNSMTATLTFSTGSDVVVRAMPEWFTALSADTQADITEMVNEGGYPLHDIQEFVETYGEQAYIDGHYVKWCELEEDCGASTEAIEAFVDEFGIDAIGSFEDAYYGEYGSESEFAEEYVTNRYTMGHMPSWVVIDWQATWDTQLRYDFAYNNGYVFNSNA